MSDMLKQTCWFLIAKNLIHHDRIMVANALGGGFGGNIFLPDSSPEHFAAVQFKIQSPCPFLDVHQDLFAALFSAQIAQFVEAFLDRLCGFRLGKLFRELLHRATIARMRVRSYLIQMHDDVHHHRSQFQKMKLPFFIEI
jgi:hypothetical protein